MAKGYTGFLLSDNIRSTLLECIHPTYENVVAHHITDAFGVDETYPLPKETRASVIGVADDGNGVQALVVAIVNYVGEEKDFRADGKRYHVTWSLANGRKAVESNDVILQGFKMFDVQYAFPVKPTFFKF